MSFADSKPTGEASHRQRAWCDPIFVKHVSTDMLDDNHRHHIECTAGRRTFRAIIVIGPNCQPFAAIDGPTPAVGRDRTALIRAVMEAVADDLPDLIDPARFRGRAA
jgi:hypothetical protein